MPPGLPRFFGGAVGWLGYDIVRSFERLPSTKPDELGLPELCFAITDTVVVFDNLRGTIKVVAARRRRRRRRPRARLRRRLRPHRGGAGSPGRGRRRRCARSTSGAGGGRRPRPTRPSRREAYEAGVRRIQEYILAGDAFQVVLSQRFEVPRGGVDPFDVYRALRVINPSPYMFHLEFPEAVVTGASPEVLVRLEGGEVEVRPIAGTRRRGASAEEDAALEAELRARSEGARRARRC